MLYIAHNIDVMSLKVWKAYNTYYKSNSLKDLFILKKKQKNRAILIINFVLSITFLT
jgi:hypothetical protein